MEPKTFNIAKFLAGQDRPRKEISVFWDLQLAQTILDIEQQIANSTDNEDVNRLVEMQNELIKQRDASAFKITVQGVPQQVLSAIDRKVEAAHPLSSEGFSSEKLRKRETYLETLRLQSYIVSVIDHEGNEEAPPSASTIQALKDYLIPTEFNKILAAMNEVENLSLAFELEVTEPLFTGGTDEPESE